MERAGLAFNSILHFRGWDCRDLRSVDALDAPAQVMPRKWIEHQGGEKVKKK